jgi:hypothetical protein
MIMHYFYIAAVWLYCFSLHTLKVTDINLIYIDNSDDFHRRRRRRRLN